MNTFPGPYGECGGGMGLCALSNCCSVVNIFILTIRVGSELRGTSHSRSAELHNWAHAAARSIFTFESNFVTSQRCCPLWPLRAAPQCEGLWLLTFVHTNVCLWCARLHFKNPHRQTLWPATQCGRGRVWVIRFAFLVLLLLLLMPWKVGWLPDFGSLLQPRPSTRVKISVYHHYIKNEYFHLKSRFVLSCRACGPTFF